MAFPPNLEAIAHVVINSAAQEELALRTGVTSLIIPNVVDFDNPPKIDERRKAAFRQSIGLMPGEVMILQPTRIIQRKGIEHAVQLVEDLADPRYKLVVSHEAGDEGFEYAEWLKEDAKEEKRLIDATQGRRTRSIIITDSNHVILSAIQAETISQRFAVDIHMKDDKKTP